MYNFLFILNDLFDKEKYFFQSSITKFGLSSLLLNKYIVGHGKSRIFFWRGK